MYARTSTATTRTKKQHQQVQRELNLISFMENEQILRKVVSDVSQEIDKYLKKLDSEMMKLGIIEEVEEAECQCCGMKEECTRVYIREVEECFCGKWICGLCAEAVKERVRVYVGGRGASQNNNNNVGMQDALKSHRDFCQGYNATTRLNPKLSLTLSMRLIAKRSSERRKPNKELGRSASYP